MHQENHLQPFLNHLTCIPSFLPSFFHFLPTVKVRTKGLFDAVIHCVKKLGQS